MELKLLAYKDTWVELDLFDETIELTRSIQDIKDISKQFADFTKSFTIPASRTNNLFFEHFTNTDTSDGYDQHKKVKAIIEYKGTEFLYGSLELLRGANKLKADNYELVFYGSTIPLSEVFKEDTLRQIDWSSLSHTTNYANIISSWSQTLLSGDVVYPLFDCSESGWYYQGGQSNPRNIAHSAGAITPDQLKPAIRMPEMLSLIFEHYGLTLTSSWLADADRQNMYIQPQSAAGPSKYGNEALYNLEVFDTDVSVSPTSGAVSLTNTVYDNSSSWGGSTYVAGYTGKHSFRLEFEGPATQLEVRKIVNGAFNSSALAPSPHLFTLDLDTSDTLQIELRTSVSTVLMEEVRLYKVDNDISQIGNTEDFSYRMPEIQVSEFIAKFLETFNLILDPVSETEYNLEPLDDWYSAGTQKDFTPYIDGSSMVVRKVDVLKQISFKHNQIESITQETFRRSTGREFGSNKYDSVLNQDVDFATKDLNIETLFGVGTPHMLTENGTGYNTGIEYTPFIDEDLKPLLSELNLFYYQGVSPSWPFYLDNAGTAVVQSQYPRCNFVRNDQTLSYNVEQTANGDKPVENLFSIYWEQYIRRIFDRDTKIIVVNAVIPLPEFAHLKLNDRIYYSGKIYTINSLKYDFKTERAQLELLTYDTTPQQKLLSINNVGVITTRFTVTPNDQRLYNTKKIGANFINTSEYQSTQAAASLDAQKTNDKTMWQGAWQEETNYPKDTMVFSDGWLMIKSTDNENLDLPQPLPSGPASYLFADSPTFSKDSLTATAIVYGNQLDFTSSVYIRKVRIYVVDENTGKVHRFFTKNVTTGKEDLSTPFTPSTAGYVELDLGETIAKTGDSLIIGCLVDNTNTTPVTFNYDWNYSLGNGTPIAGQIIHESAGSVMRVHEQDDTNTDRSTQLDNITAGSTIEANGVTWEVAGATKTGDVYTFTVIPALKISAGNYTFTFTYYNSTVLTYPYISSYWPTNDPSQATMTGVLIDDTGADVGVSTTGYLVDVQLQDIALNPDYSVMTYSPSLKTGGVISGL